MSDEQPKCPECERREREKGPPCTCGSKAIFDERRHAVDCERRRWVEANNEPCPRCDGTGFERMVPLAKAEELVRAVDVFLNAELDTEEYQDAFLRLTKAQDEIRFGGGER